MEVLNTSTSFNLHVFSMEGWLPPPILPSDFDSLPYSWGGGVVILFCKMTTKDVVTITYILNLMNLGILVLCHENW